MLGIRIKRRNNESMLGRGKVRCLENMILNGSRLQRNMVKDLSPTVIITVEATTVALATETLEGNGLEVRQSRGERRERSPTRSVPKESREEGELSSRRLQRENQEEQEPLKTIPPQEIPPATTLDQTDSLKVPLVSENVEIGLEIANEKVGNGNNSLDDEVMDLDETRVDMNGIERFNNVDIEFQNLNDEEVEETDALQEDMHVNSEVEPQPGEAEDKALAIGDEGKKRGRRKVLFKQTVMVGGNTKKDSYKHLFPHVNVRQ
ncbi:hypothetical protein N665_0378s0002 [Sinapis alba]|nr:hypothetical protein N665_0378s0002 [Sinapis alba]